MTATHAQTIRHAACRVLRTSIRGGGAVSVLGLLLAGCAAVPDLGPRPAMIAPASVAATQSLAVSPAAQWPREDWWQAYGDPQLDRLIAEGFAASPDVAAAAARFRRAEALAQQAGAATRPRLDIEGNAGLQKQSLNMGLPEQLRSNLPRGWNDSGQVAANLGFDPDLWGRGRAALAAARGEARAAAIDARQARLMLAVGIASAYVDLGRLFALRDVRAREVETAGQSARLIARREANGLETRGAVANAEAAVARARLTLGQADEALALRRHQLAVLVGAGPDRGLAVTRPAIGSTALRDLPEGVTTDLIGRRPDIAAARERAEAAGNRIAVARAEFFPAIRISALLGVQALGLGQLIDADSTFGSVGPAISLPVFRGGELQGRYRGARADYDAAVASYNGAVLTAYQQVADALTSNRAVAGRLADARAAQDAVEAAHREIALRYKGGLANYLQVIQVEDRVLEARLAVVELEAALQTTDIALVRALGGGFAPAGTIMPNGEDTNNG